MRSLLEFEPDRLGHVICVPEEFRGEILRREIAVELCLSCNVKAGLTRGGFAGASFGEWREGCFVCK
jgi:adenosine deaminase